MWGDPKEEGPGLGAYTETELLLAVRVAQMSKESGGG